MINKNILITGGTGYVGTHLALKLLKNNFKIIVVDNLINSKIDVIKKIKKISGKSIKFYKVDIRNKNALFKVFKKNKIHSVIHLAALKSVNESIKKASEYYKNNVLGTINLIEIMKKFNVKKMIFSSSAVVYGNSKYLPCKESQKTNPTNPYKSLKILLKPLSINVGDRENMGSCFPLFSVVCKICDL